MDKLSTNITCYKTCSSSDTNSDMDDKVRQVKRSKIKIGRKITTHYESQNFSSSSEDELCKVTDSFAPNMLACKHGQEAYNAWLEEDSKSDVQEQEGIVHLNTLSRSLAAFWQKLFNAVVHAGVLGGGRAHAPPPLCAELKLVIKKWMPCPMRFMFLAPPLF